MSWHTPLMLNWEVCVWSTAPSWSMPSLGQIVVRFHRITFCDNLLQSQQVTGWTGILESNRCVPWHWHWLATSTWYHSSVFILQLHSQMRMYLCPELTIADVFQRSETTSPPGCGLFGVRACHWCSWTTSRSEITSEDCNEPSRHIDIFYKPCSDL